MVRTDIRDGLSSEDNIESYRDSGFLVEYQTFSIHGVRP